jgi:hypothetical protein
MIIVELAPLIGKSDFSASLVEARKISRSKYTGPPNARGLRDLHGTFLSQKANLS